MHWGEVSDTIAEVHPITLPSGATTPTTGETNTVADEAARAPGSEQLLSMFDTSTGEGLVIHLWKELASYEANAERRQAMTSEQVGAGTKIDPGRIYEVTYRS